MLSDGTPQPSTTRDADVTEELSLDFCWALLAIHKWTIVAVTVLVLAVVSLYDFSVRPTYQAEATLWIEPTLPSVLGDVKEVSELGVTKDDDAYYRTQYAVLESDSLLSEVVRRSRLEEDREFLGLEDGTEAEEKTTASGVVTILRQRLTIDPRSGTELVRVRIRDWDPYRAAVVSNLIGDVYIEWNLSRRLEATKNAVAWLEVQMEGLQQQLGTSEEELHAFKRDNDILSVALADRQNMVAAELETFNRALSESRIKRIDYEARFAEAERTEGNPALRLSLPAVLADQSVQRLLSKIGHMREQLVELEQRYEPTHPAHSRVQLKLRTAERAVAQRVATIVGALRIEADRAREVEAGLLGALGQTKARAQDLGSKEMTFNRLKRELDTNRSIHDMVLARLKETNLTGHLESNNVRFLDRAKPPAKPASPNIPLHLGLALFFGLAAGIALARLLMFLDDTIKSRSDIEQALSLTFLGIIPAIKMAGIPRKRVREFFGGAKQTGPRQRDLDLYVHTHPASHAAECCRTVRSNLLFMSPDKPLQTIAITSAEGEAGKTSTTVRLGVMMAQTQGKTLLVDADMRRSQLQTVFGVPNETGLSTVIAGGCELDEAIKHTEIPNLDVLTSGRTPPNPAELLHSKQFANLVSDLDERYDLVIFDTPPLLSVTDALILARNVDGVVLVARWDKTAREMLRRCAQQLLDVQVRILGTVVNDIDLEMRAYSYYHGRMYKGGYYTYYARTD